MLETSKIELHGDISIPFLKKSRFTGSFKGMRYVLIKHEKELEPATEETPAKTETCSGPSSGRNPLTLR